MIRQVTAIVVSLFLLSSIILVNDSLAISNQEEKQNYVEIVDDHASGKGMNISIVDMSDTIAYSNHDFMFVAEFDGDNISTVFLEYWFEHDLVHVNESFEKSDKIEITIMLPNHVRPLYYIFSANNTEEKWFNTTIVKIEQLDITAPVFDELKLSPEIPKTGKLFINTTITDNDLVKQASLNYRFSRDESFTTIMDPHIHEDNFSWEIEILDDVDCLYVTLGALDPSNNSNFTSIKFFEVNSPWFSHNTFKPEFPTTGSWSNITIDVFDNGLIIDESVEMHYNLNGTWLKDSMNFLSGETYWTNLTVDGSKKMFYYFCAKDDNGYFGSSDLFTLVIVDDDLPIFTDISSSIATTGDNFTFKVKASDNVNISFVNVTWSHGILGGIESLKYIGNGTFTLNVTLDQSIDKLDYRISVTDTSLNTVIGNPTEVSVDDNDPPEFLNVEVDPERPVTGQLIIQANINDNIEAKSPVLYFRLDNTSTYNKIFANGVSGNVYNFRIMIPPTADHLYFNITSSDLIGNSYSTPVYYYPVNLPQIGTITYQPSIPTTGEKLNISINEVNDNDGVEKVCLNYNDNGTWKSADMNHIDNQGYWLEIFPDGGLELLYYISAFDESWNENRSSLKKISVYDNDIPTFQDYSNNTGTTGENFTFNLSARDNVRIDRLIISWKHGSRSGSISFNENETCIYRQNITLDHSLDKLIYTVEIYDTSANSLKSNEISTDIYDNDAPVYSNIKLDPENPFTGTLKVMVNWTDNIEVRKPVLQYRLDNFSGFTNLTSYEKKGDVYIFSLNVPSKCDHLFFNASASDPGENIVVSPTIYREVNIPIFANLSYSPTVPSTGESFTVKILVLENSQLQDVVLYYKESEEWNWINMTSVDGRNYSIDIDILDSATNLSFYIEAKDDVEYLNKTEIIELSVKDNDDPIFTDISKSKGTTGDDYFFKIKASDNSGVSNVSIHWTYGTSSDWFFLDNEEDDVWIKSIRLNHSLISLKYKVRVNDTSGNFIEGPYINIPVKDNDDPVFSNIIINPEDPITGILTIAVNWTDNIGLKNVTLEYRLDNVSGYTNLTKYTRIDDIFYYKIVIMYSTDHLYFNVSAMDDAGNIARSSTIYSEVNLPQLGKTTTLPSSPSTGGKVNFTVDVTDNGKIDNVKIFLNITGDGWESSTMKNSQGDTYFYECVIDGTTSVDYYYVVEDDNGFKNISKMYSKTIEDNDAPHFNDLTNSKGTTGDEFTFQVDATDNVEIKSVSITWSHGSLGDTMLLSENKDGIFTGIITLDSSISALSYVIRVTDNSSNYNESTSISVVVDDNDKPRCSDIKFNPQWPRIGSLEIEVTWTDNIQLKDVMMSYKYDNNTLAGYKNLTTYTNIDDVFIFKIIIPADAKHLFFNLSANDTSGNLVILKTNHYMINVPEIFDIKVTPESLTTGEIINISVKVVDDGQVENVILHYNDDGSWHFIEMTLNTGSIYDIELYVYSGSSEFRYYIQTEDDDGFKNSTTEKVLKVKDNDSPVLLDYSSPGTTDDIYVFNVSIKDNIGLESGVKIEWSHDGMKGSDNMTDDGRGLFSYRIKLNDSVSDLYYTIIFEDVNGHKVIYKNILPVNDNDDPTFSDYSLAPDAPETGEVSAFTVRIFDNIGNNDELVKLFYKDITDNEFYSVSMEILTFDTFHCEITIPMYFSEIIFYFQAEDDYGNVGNSTEYKSKVIDNISPVFIYDKSKSFGTTGDNYTFELVLKDNVGIDQVIVEYWYGSEKHIEINLNIEGSGLGYEQICWTNISNPTNSLDHLYYRYHFCDGQGNWWTLGPSKVMEVILKDNDPPEVNSVQQYFPSTGDPFHFSINITDNIDRFSIVEAYLLWTYGDDWDNPTNLSLTFDPDCLRWNSSTFDIQLTSLEMLNYSIGALDKSGNWMISNHISYVIDNDLPEMVSDQTPSVGTTGDPLTFTVTTRDNINVAKVELSLIFQGGKTYHGIPLTQVSSDIWSITWDLDHHLGTCLYHFTIYDSSYNHISTTDSTISISDNDPPEFFSDMCSKTTYTGAVDYSFRIIIFDNIEIMDANVHYYFDFDQTERIQTMEVLSEDIFFCLINIPNECGKMTYWFDATDIGPAFNYNDTSGIKKVVIIQDNKDPVIGIPDYKPQATTGDDFRINVVITDDVNVSGTRMYYYFGSVLPGTVNFVEGSDSSGIYTFQIDVPNSLDPLNFWIEAFDLGGNTAQTILFQVEVIDNDAPGITEFLSDSDVATGEEFTFKLIATDNIMVGRVDVTYRFTGMEPMTGTMGMEGDSYMLMITVPNDIRGTLEFHFMVYDTSGNMVQSDPFMIEVLDDEPPIARIIGPTEAFQHEEVTFSASMSSDNVGIVEYTWTIMDEALTGMEVTYVFDDVGEYTITLLVTDGVNPAVELSTTITIRDADKPVIVIYLPGLIGNHERLRGNASGSHDNVGITIFTWTLLMPDNSLLTAIGPILDVDLEGIIGNITVYLSVIDAEGNDAIISRFVDIEDLLSPTAVGPNNMTVMEGETHDLVDMGSFDNVGITEWTWSIDGPIGKEKISGKRITYFFERPGNYSFILTVQDSAGNIDSMSFYVLVSEKPADLDSDNDGMPDIWEEENGLDKTVNDRNRDYDSDSLSNLREYELGTDPRDPDTDNDGLPDNYEVRFGFDPLVYGDQDDDPDGDGDSNLEEYLEGPNARDPTIDDDAEDHVDNTPRNLVIMIFSAIAVLLIMGISVRLFGRRKKVEEDFPKKEFEHLYRK